jgi:hypothetical protein
MSLESEACHKKKYINLVIKENYRLIAQLSTKQGKGDNRLD